MNGRRRFHNNFLVAISHPGHLERQEIEAVIGPISDGEWTKASGLLESIERNPDTKAVLDSCIARGLSVDQTIAELSKARPH